MDVLAANTTGDVYYRDADALVIGSIGGVDGITSDDDDGGWR